MMNCKKFTYHALKGFPASLNLPTKTYLLNYTKHARQEALKDMYADKISLPTHLDFSSVDISKIVVVNKTITKMMCRKPYNEELDLTLVIDPRDRSVITVWLNEKNDNLGNIYLHKYNRASTI